jgi:hypothetical protein
MADKKISALTAATTPLDGTEVLPIVQSGATVKVANNDLRPKQIQSNATSGVLQVAGPASAATRVMTTPDANFTAARIDAAQSFTGDQTLSTGNLIPGTAAKGVNFTANTPQAGMTSQLLNWYEAGTWTPVLKFGGGTTGITYAIQLGSYTRVGRLVTITCLIVLSNKGSSTGIATVTGLPFSNAAGFQFVAQGSVCFESVTFAGQVAAQLPQNSSSINITQTSVLGARSNLADTNFANASEFDITLSYFTA